MLFGISSSGATVQLHYCCGKLKSISFGSIAEKDCGMQGKMGSKPCCETKSVSAKEQSNDHEVYTIALGVKAPVEPLVLEQVAPELFIAEEPVNTPVIQSSPPLIKDISLLNCVFRI